MSHRLSAFMREVRPRLADHLATHAFALDTMGELFARRLGCVVDRPLGSGSDLAALCRKASS